MKTIPLNKGRVTLVDDGDFIHLNQWKWTSHETELGKGRLYAVRYERGKDGKLKRIYLHRKLKGNSSKKYVDHIDRNTLNNQRNNLRLCNQSQSRFNSNKKVGNKTGYKGVTWDKFGKRYTAVVGANWKRFRLGYFKTAKAAALAYDIAADKIHGKFSMTNKKLGLV